MAIDLEFRDYVLDQLRGIGEFETKNMFGGTAVLINGAAFAKIKHGSLWLKADKENVDNFAEMGMPQYTYGKDNSRKLNFYETPADVLEDQDVLVQWAKEAYGAALRSKK